MKKLKENTMITYLDLIIMENRNTSINRKRTDINNKANNVIKLQKK